MWYSTASLLTNVDQLAEHGAEKARSVEFYLESAVAVYRLRLAQSSIICEA